MTSSIVASVHRFSTKLPTGEGKHVATVNRAMKNSDLPRFRIKQNAGYSNFKDLNYEQGF
jgi:hypothetical protein